MIYIVRHCQTEDNSQKILCSNKDLELSSFGVERAKKIADFFSDKNIDYILTSVRSKRQSLVLDS